jgi:hypothetical protein
VCKIGRPCLIALWQNSKIFAGALVQLKLNLPKEFHYWLQDYLQVRASVRSDALIISSPATNLFSSYSMLEAIKLNAKYDVFCFALIYPLAINHARNI